MKKILIISILSLLIVSQAFGFGAAIKAVLSAGNVATYAKVLATQDGTLIATASGYLIRTPATENWNKLLITPDGTLVVTPSGYAIKVN